MSTHNDPDTINKNNREMEYEEFVDTFPQDETLFEARQDSWADRNLW